MIKSFNLTEKTCIHLKKIAESEQRSVSKMVEIILTEYIEKHTNLKE